MAISKRLINVDALSVRIFVDRRCDQAIIMREERC